ncbi:MAG: hypothetical protein JXR65_08965 [Bacteroidales bacterium]|nr:hypothetical protein [Bacteroidales bacterium]
MNRICWNLKYHFSVVVVLFLILILSSPQIASAQSIEKSVKTKKEKTSKVVIPRSPQKAMLWAIIPGGGQIYNHKYWKVPIVYAGFAVIGYTAAFNTREYRTYRDAYNCAVLDTSACTNPIALKYPASSIKIVRDYYRRNMQLSYIVMGAWYLLQIIDANVDAQFTHWNVSDNLSMDVYPVLKTPVGHNRQAYNGIGLRFSF